MSVDDYSISNITFNDPCGKCTLIEEFAVFNQTVVLITSSLIRTDYSPCFVSFEYLLQFDLAPCETSLSCFCFGVYVVSVLWIRETHQGFSICSPGFWCTKETDLLGGKILAAFSR